MGYAVSTIKMKYWEINGGEIENKSQCKLTSW